MYRKFLFLTSFVLLLSLASISYGDLLAPRPASAMWSIVPTTLGTNEITMTVVDACDVGGDYPVDYNFVCTNYDSKTSGWQPSPTYTLTDLNESTTYTFKVQMRDSAGNVGNWSLTTISTTTDADTDPNVLRLDLNYYGADANYNDDVNTYPGFTKFTLINSGSEVNGVIIDLGGNLSVKRNDDPCGAWEKYGGGASPDPCYYSPRAGERIYRDMISGYGAPASGVTITLWGLGTNQDCNITMWAYDIKSTGADNRTAIWTANGIHIFDTSFTGGSTTQPGYENQPPPAQGPRDLYKHAYSARVTSDNFGRIILASTKGPSSAEPFAFVNALKVEPNDACSFTPTPYAHRPVPFDGTENVHVDTDLNWRNGAGVVTHDLYLGDDFDDVNDADANSQGPGVLIFAPGLTSNTYDPYGATGFLELDTTYYWRVDENPGIYKGEVWSFTTCPNSVVDNFNSYPLDDSGALRAVWKDWWNQPNPRTRAVVFTNSTDPNLDVPPAEPARAKSLRYLYENDLSPYYSEARANTADTAVPPARNGLGIDPDWLGMGAKSLVLSFYGKVTNDANEQMYVKLTDGASLAGKVKYPLNKMNDIREAKWHEWNIDLQDFVGNPNNVNLANVAQVTIGFGDGLPAGDYDGIPDNVWFENIQLYATRCALAARSDDFAKIDYAPIADGGDCAIDSQELDLMADVWLNRDALIFTKRPSDTNLVVYYPMNEGDGNKVYSHRDSNHCTTLDPCDANWTGTFWNNGGTTPGYFGTTWATPGYDNNNLPDVNHCVYMTGEQGSRIQCGDPNKYGHLALGIGPRDINAITVSAWVKSLGPRTWDGYLNSKFMGILGKRGGWDEQSVVWMFSVTPSAQAFCFTSYQGGLYSAGILSPFWGQWIHLAATYPHPAANPADANSHARIYLNGGQVNSGLFLFSHGWDPNIYLSIGETQDQNAWNNCPESFYGYIDEVRIYNRALEPNEIAYLADVTPWDGQLWIPIPSPVEVYPPDPENHQGSNAINFKDFALVVNQWLKEEMFPR